MMINLPSARRLILPSLILAASLVACRLLLQQWLPSQDALLQVALQAHLGQQSAQARLIVNKINNTTGKDGHLPHSAEDHRFMFENGATIPLANPRITRFQSCTSASLNNVTSHLRLPNELFNITLSPPRANGDDAEQSKEEQETTRFFNPAIIPLPYWSSGGGLGGPKYALVSRVVTSGFHQESHICLADICEPAPLDPTKHALAPDTRACTAEDLELLGPRGGMRCTAAAGGPPIKLNIPPTPAERCAGAWLAFPDIPGFHDPRVFWSGKGEPLILVNSASRYGCVGLWLVDLRRLFPALAALVSRDGRGGSGSGSSSRGPLSSYPHLTEITRNPRSSRAAVEKNWVLWFPARDDAYVQYDLLGRSVHQVEPGPEPEDTLGKLLVRNGTNHTDYTDHTATAAEPSSKRRGGRTFAKLTGNGFTTRNLTHPDEEACFGADQEKDTLGNQGHWHQGSNTLRLILCTRAEARRGQCASSSSSSSSADETALVAEGLSVHFAVVHRKFSNELDLPLRYERYVVVWESRAPFQMLGVSRWPLLMRNERANPWTEEENWPTKSGGGGEEEEPKTEAEAGERAARGWNASMTGPEPGDGIFASGHPYAGGGVKRQRQRREDEDDDSDNDAGSFHRSQAYFTYTPSLAWAWRPYSEGLGQEQEEDDDDVEYMSHLGTGYLGDEVIVGIGMDDVSQAFAKVKVDDLLQCLRLCPGVKIGS